MAEFITERGGARWPFCRFPGRGPYQQFFYTFRASQAPDEGITLLYHSPRQLLAVYYEYRSHRQPINISTLINMTGVFHLLRRCVQECAQCGVGMCPTGTIWCPYQIKVAQPCQSITIKEDVLWFDVAVDQTPKMCGF